MGRRAILWSVAVVAVGVVAGCEHIFPTQAVGPQRVLVRDLYTDGPIAGAEVEYTFVSFGPRASVRTNRHGQIEVEPRFRMPDLGGPVAKPLPGGDVNKVWDQYNEPPDRGPVFNSDGSWDTANFRERSIQRTAVTGPDGCAFLPIIHAPIRFRECRLRVVKAGYKAVTDTIRVADLGRLIERHRVIAVYLAPLRETD